MEARQLTHAHTVRRILKPECDVSCDCVWSRYVMRSSHSQITSLWGAMTLCKVIDH